MISRWLAQVDSAIDSSLNIYLHYCGYTENTCLKVGKNQYEGSQNIWKCIFGSSVASKLGL